jgi:hypothetical protein
MELAEEAGPNLGFEASGPPHVFGFSLTLQRGGKRGREIKEYY